MVDIIERKRNGEVLSKDEITFFVTGYTNGSIPDYQASALLMAIYFSGMNAEEQGYLTMAMVESGDQIDLSAIEGIKVDKHSTGGVGDTTTLILAPLVAACGVPVAKMSGRGLGHTGGTLDKLESIEGFHIELTEEQFVNQVNQLKLAVIGQSGNLTPADKKLYALRDVTATVESIALIASSIMSKKIAAGADAIVLDVKTGEGAFMKTLEDAEKLASAMVAIGKQVGRETMAVISDMNQPLGYAIGNALEVKEAIDTLKGEGPDDLTELCIALGSKMIMAGGKASSMEEAKTMLQKVIEDGSALTLFSKMIAAQGGNSEIVHNPELMPKADYQIEVPAPATGYITKMEADEIGVAAMLLGAGRATKEDEIDLAVGIVLNKKIGDHVEKGEALAVIHSNRTDVTSSLEMLQKHIHIGQEQVDRPTLIYKTIMN
ncbi:pyrimidine-nucleoside phosphorylase [Sporosarcina sp. NCCP-2222]|uniref:pyrimidine-nucleoside phosphorylase n=1 Tax=Sporosarcina sp. NCCP-2222 TaxID=2935073 RepID=UPI00208543DC|nr:pyrimidine-nucleoside phosphorylase [Sporosarcina sp. NCCP-2222]GKV55480.1 pyrimidine-nucleoside phosphorylase [Sporosarcina sp. NCCP-2222]